jgi:hypothetical protein
MRRGMSPFDAGMDALKRIARNYGGDRERLRYIDVTYYVLRRDGAYAGVSLWTGYEPGKPHMIGVHDNTSANKRNPDPNMWVGFGERSVGSQRASRCTPSSSSGLAIV